MFLSYRLIVSKYFSLVKEAVMRLLLTAKSIQSRNFLLFQVQHFCYSEKVTIPRLLKQSENCLADYNVYTIAKKLSRAESLCYSAFL